MDVREHPYAPFLERVQKPSRYVGGEHGAADKPWEAARARMCLAFPDVYEVGMSHLGFKILYSLLNAEPDLLAERAYAPWVDMERELRERDEPLRSLESWHALSEFDVVGVSLQFELTYTNVLQMLELGGIALRSEDRGEDAPLVVAGGPSATHPEPLAPFLDAIVIGDGEEVTPALLRRWVDDRERGVPRAQRLAHLAELTGVYVPSLYTTAPDPDTGLEVVQAPVAGGAAPYPVVRAFVEDVSDYPFPKDGPIANTETVFDRVSVEIARGCTEGCRFCQAGMIYRPVREREPGEVLDVVGHAVRELGYDGVSLTSLSTADYSAIAPLIHRVAGELKPARATLSVSSLRAYGLAEDVLDELAEGGAKGLTFAPEAGTQRMRDVVNKNVTEEQLLETARRVFSRGWQRMKLYFMIGLPTEEDEDVIGIAETGRRARAVGRELIGKRARVTVNVSTHVPKPHTPFQWCAMDGREEVLRKQSLLREHTREGGVELRVHDSTGSWIEGVLARGDRRLADVVEGAYRRGARFDSWEEQLDLPAWRAAFEEAGLDPADYLGTIPTTARLPWDHLDVGLADGFLAKEYRKALRNRLSPPCGKAVGAFVHHDNLETHEDDRRKLVCYDCGVACDMTAMRSRRGDFLIGLQALTPRPKRAVARAAAEAKPKRGPARPPVRADQGTPVRVRLRFEKLGRAAYGSHLDLVRLLPRLMRRAGLPLYYSLGFNSKPVMTFGPALPLGVHGLSEYVDIKLAEGAAVDEAALPALLSDESIDGVRFTAARVLAPGDVKLTKLIDRASYVVGLPNSALEQLGVGSAGALATLLSAARSGALTARRNLGREVKDVDVGRYLREVRVGEGSEALARAGLVGDLVPVRIEMAITGQGTARAREALDALTGAPDLPARVVRVGLYCGEGEDAKDPLELEALRRERADTPAEPVLAEERSGDPAASGAPSGLAARGEGSRDASPGRATGPTREAS